MIYQLQHKDGQTREGFAGGNEMTDTSNRNARSIQVEPIDHRHPSWSQVLAAVLRTGNPGALMLHEDGWLSSRQTLLAAFDGSQLVGHLCFSVEPSRAGDGTPTVKSKVDSFSIEPTHSDSQVDELLLRQANRQARLMKCTPPQLELELVAC
jgi:hypothetical protein